MTPDEIALSRRAGRIVNMIAPDIQIKFREAVRAAASISDVRAPYRSWLINPRNIPTDQRSKVYDPRTGTLVDRPMADLSVD